MLFKVEVGAAVYALKFFPTEWKFKFNINSGISIVGKFYVVVVS